MSDGTFGVGWVLGGLALTVALALVGAGVLLGWWLL